jgi:hypothetical protein
MAAGVGLLGSELRDFEAERWKEMMDGDVSHPSDIKLPTFRIVVVLGLFSLWFSSCFPFTLFLYYVLHLVCLFSLLFLYQ